MTQVPWSAQHGIPVPPVLVLSASSSVTKRHAIEMFPVGHDLVRMSGAELVLTCDGLSRHLAAETARTSTSFTIFEGTSEIQRVIIGRAVTGLDVR
jgi:alkylation response protein AidB-like acyl-CoA dehydrogenase